MVSDKISIDNTLGYYVIKILDSYQITHPVIRFNYTDRYGKSGSSHITNRQNNPYQYDSIVLPPSIHISKVYYNTGDRILITNLTNGEGNYTLYDGIKYYGVYSLVKMNNNLTGYIQGQGTSTDQGYYAQFSWYVNEIRDWRVTSSWVYSQEIPNAPGATRMGPYNYPLAYTLEAGW